ncbi:MAG: HAMP domain-containing sensor histidine kinase [Candidatus Nanopelagicales bacterium]
MSLRTKLAVAFALVALGVAIAVGTLAYLATANRLNAEIDRSLQQQADLVAGALIRQPPPGEPDRFDPGRDPLRLPGDDDLPTQVLTGDGRAVAAPNATVDLPVDESDLALARSGTRSIQTRDVVIDGTAYRMVTQSLGDGRGAVQVASDRSETDRLLTTMATALAAVGLLVVLAAAAVGWYVARRITGRLVRLTAAVEEVGSTGRLDVDVPREGADEVARLGGEFDAMLARLAASREDQQRLVQDAAHELRTPLTSLRTNISLLGSFEDLDPATRSHVLADLQGETRELTHLVDEIVDLAIEAPAQADAEPVDLAAVAHRVAERARRRSGREVTVTADASTVVGSAAALERALWNLVDNAAKFDGSGAPIEIGVHEGTVWVADRGPGVAPQDRDRVFDRFYRADDVRGKPGSGLGLAIVREIAVAHGGTVFVDDRDGGGAVLGMRLPATPSTAQA